MTAKSISVFVLEPNDETWLPADISIDHAEVAECETCKRMTRDWMVTYVQGGPPGVQTDPDNVWVYQCLPCALVESGGNVMNMDVALELGLVD